MRAGAVQVPANGTLDIEYELALSGSDGTIPSQVGKDMALLLARTLFVVPEAWLSDLRAPLSNTLQIMVKSVEGWATYTSWPTVADGVRYAPRTLDDLFSSAIVTGEFDGYELSQDNLRLRLLMPMTDTPLLAARRATGPVVPVATGAQHAGRCRCHRK